MAYEQLVPVVIGSDPRHDEAPTFEGSAVQRAGIDQSTGKWHPIVIG
jgi:hypothetical protein